MGDTSTIAVRDLTFAVRTAGPADGAPVMLLHGFPETSAMWTPLMRELAAAGYVCAAPDQRGYSQGARPAGLAAYAYDELTADVFALADALAWRRFHLIAHDWGAGVGWRALRRDPARIASYTALSIPHYRAFAEATWADGEAEPYRRFLRLVLAADGAAERVLSRDDFASFRRAWSADAELTEQYLQVIREPGALPAMLAWYRASDGHRALLRRPPDAADQVATPSLLLWGRDDPHVRAGSLDRARRFMDGPYRVVEVDAGHWLAQEAPDVVRREALAHLAAHPL